MAEHSISRFAKTKLSWIYPSALFGISLMLASVFLSAQAFASQTIIIENNINVDVYGNGTPPDGAWSTSWAGSDNNAVIVKNSATVFGDGYGGFEESSSDSVTVRGNSVTVSEGSNITNIYGGWANSTSDIATASSNSVTISGASSVGTDAHGGWAYSYYGIAMATANMLIINGNASVGDEVYGGKADSYQSALSFNNSVDIFDSQVDGNVYGGRSISVTGNSVSSNNNISIVGSVVGSNTTKHIYGGYANFGGSNDGDEAIANYNRIYIENSTIHGTVIGGYSQVNQLTEIGMATYNTVTIAGNNDLSAIDLYGGLVKRDNARLSSADYFTGNTLNVWGFQGQVDELAQFQQINFVLSADHDFTRPMLVVESSAELYEYAGANRSSTITVSTFSNAVPLQVNDQVDLITAGFLVDDKFTEHTAYGRHGATLRYIWNLTATSNGTDTLTATLVSVDADPQVKAVSEAFISGAALVEQGADLLVGQGLGRAIQAGQAVGQSNFSAFGAFSTNKQRYATGSHLDLSGLSLLAGLSRGLNLSAGRLTLAGFIEYGHGKYDTFNAFNNIFNNPVEAKGSGTLNHFGGGLLGQLDFASQGAGHAYLEAGLRFGQLNNEFNGSDFQDDSGDDSGPVELGYEAKSAYFGLHLGAGYVLKLGNSASLDLYAKYFWTRLAGGQVSLSGGDLVDFAAINTHRARAGLRLNYLASQLLSPYAGLAVDYTFGGKAKATTYGIAIDAPSLEGATGLAELGLSLRPVQNLSLDLGVQGYVGTRKGFSGSLQLRFVF